MAIDFSQVKTITIPEGSVTKITDSNGVVLWQGAGWHTVWEGNQKIGYGGPEKEFVFATVPYSDTLKIRVTFGDLYAYPSNEHTAYIPSNKVSPVTYENFNSIGTSLVRAYTHNNSTGSAYSSYLSYNKNTGEISGDWYTTGSGTGARTYVVITKIEVYS